MTKYLNGEGIDNKLRMQTGSDIQYFLTDHLGSTNGLTDVSGNLTSSASYDSFGNATGNINTRYQFTGREFDSFTGLHYYRARWYDAQLGRFISEDPIGFAGGDVNLYGYVWNSPNGFTDPMGLDGWGNDTADWLDERIDYAHQYWRYNDQEWVANGINQTVADVSYGVADLFRVGNGLAQAYYCEDSIWGKLAFITMDIARAAGISSIILGATAGRVGGRPVPGEVEPYTPNTNPADAIKLKKSLASQQQMSEAGQPMAGAGTNKVFRDAPRIAKQYGGNPSDWVKMRSSSYTSSEVGGMQQFETHWVQNVRTGQRVEFKTKFPRLGD